MLSRSNSCMEQKFGSQYSIRESVLGGVDESEVVEELVEILVECVKKVDVRGQEILLRKFFFEIEKEIPLQRFLVERIKHSKISSLFDNIIPASSGEDFRFETEMVSTRELKVGTTSSEEEEKKLERFKVKTIQVGVVVKEENARS